MTWENTAPASLKKFQSDFGRHLRAPGETKRPRNLPARPVAVYRELLFNNVCGFIDRCFPVASSLMPEARWRRLCRTFFRDWRCSTPIFAEIPHEFVRYATETPIAAKLPAWFGELLHYEWVELEVDMSRDAITDQILPAGGKKGELFVNASLRNLAYQWPVHKISPDYRPRKKIPSFLAVYRKLDMSVEFVELNSLTHRLLDMVSGGMRRPEIVLKALAREVEYPDPDRFVEFGFEIVADLVAKDILIYGE